jgi:hypothetical protein
VSILHGVTGKRQDCGVHGQCICPRVWCSRHK